MKERKLFSQVHRHPRQMQSFGKRNLLGGVPEGGRWEWIIRIGSDYGVPRKHLTLFCRLATADITSLLSRNPYLHCPQLLVSCAALWVLDVIYKSVPTSDTY